MSNKTIVYYTANQEDERFERLIVERLTQAAGDIPIISVSHRPMDLGTNICVGEKAVHDVNLLRQIQIGVEAAQTPFILAAESDCLYPPEYFTFYPPTEDCYRYTNLWILHTWVGRVTKGLFWRKRYSDCAQIAGRDFWLRKLEVSLAGHPEWVQLGDSQPRVTHQTKTAFYWEGKNPVINIKTGHGLRKYTGTMRGVAPAAELPYWGSAADLRKALS